jgi:hypothetical protein
MPPPRTLAPSALASRRTMCVRMALASLGAGGLACSGGGIASPSALVGDAGASRDAASGGPGPSAASDASGGSPADDGEAAASVPLACTSTPVDHSAGCPGSSCPIVDDVAVTCNSLAGVGALRVAPGPEVTWMATSTAGQVDGIGTGQLQVFRIAQGRASREDGIPEPESMWYPIVLALSPDGEPSVAVAETLRFGTSQQVGLGADVFLSHGASGWTSSTITTPDANTLLGMEIGTDGLPHAWMSGPGPVYFHATRNGAGTWTMEPAPLVPMGAGYTEFTLTADNQPAALDFVPASTSYPGYPWQLTTLVGGVETALGSPLEPTGPFNEEYSVTYGIMPAAAPSSGPRLGAAYQGSDGIHVAWMQSPAPTTVGVPSSTPPAFDCTSQYDGGCPGPCHETAVGVENRWFALAWTADGTGWLAYVVTHYDKQLHFTLDPPCTNVESCGLGPECSEWVDADATSYVLHLARVPSGGGLASDVLSVPVASPVIASLDGVSGVRTLDARGFGTNLAIGILTGDSSGNGTARVLRIDTTQFSGDF